MDFSGERFIPGKAFGQIEAEHLQRYMGVSNLVRDKVVLDAACGEGYGSSILAQHAKEVIGVDISRETIEWARSKYNLENLSFLNCSIDKLPFPDNSIDVVVSFETIEHVSEEIQDKFMREIKRVLKFNGQLVISTPNKLTYSDLPDKINPFHVKEFYTDEFNSFLKSFFSHVLLYKQKKETVMLLDPLDKDVKKEYTFLNNLDEHESDFLYVIAICSNSEIPMNITNNFINVPDDNVYPSTLYIDFGGGYSDDVKVMAKMEIKDNVYKVSFKNLEPLKDIKSLRWKPIDQPIQSIKINTVQTNVSTYNIICTNENEYVTYFDLEGEYENLEYINFFGSIHVMEPKKIKEHLEKKIQEFVDLNTDQLRDINYFKQQNENDKNSIALLNQELVIRDNCNVELNQALKQTETLKETLELENVKKSTEIEYLLNEINQNKDDIISLNSTIDEIKGSKMYYEQLYNEIINSTSWRLTFPLREAGRVGRRSTKNLFGVLVKDQTKLMRYLKRVYNKLPVDIKHKVKIKNFVYNNLAFLFSETLNYRSWLISKQDNKLLIGSHKTSSVYNKEIGNEIQINPPGTIAIHVHLFYIDLMDEFISYLDNIPFSFDLYISVTESKYVENIENRFKSINTLNNVEIKVVSNRGRDVAPMVVDFGSKLLKYDYICHIHTKKSLYTGNEQTIWRKHLLDNLIGSEEIIRKNLYLLSSTPDVGLLYPETVSFIPYWAHTWLANKGKSTELLRSMNIDLGKQTYIDYPAGTMFWAKGTAISSLFKLNLNLSNFEVENKQTDGTLAHAIERSIVPIVKSAGYTFIEVNFSKNIYRLNNGNKNLGEYWKLNTNVLKEYVFDSKSFDAITFDIFDTLITRPILDPDSIFKVIEIKLKNLNIELSFISMRKESELSLRQKNNFQGDCNIDEIYEEMRQSYKIDKNIIETIKAVEIQTEIDMSIPRSDMRNLIQHLYEKGENIILISDMYLKKSQVKELLKKSNIELYNELWVSSETGKRKDTGEAWQYLLSKYPKDKIVHIGDNERSDIQIPTDMGVFTIHTMSSKGIFENTKYGDYILSSINGKTNWAEDILLGLITSKYLNNPYCLNETEGQFKVDNFKKLGYSIFGPVFLHFFTWLIKRVKENNIRTVLFPAREGYFLKQVFDLLLEEQLIPFPVKSVYLLASRRAVSIPSINNLEDIYEILGSNFTGSFSNLLKTRYGLSQNIIDENDDYTVNLPNDIERVKKDILKYKERIIEEVESELKEYKNYCEKVDILRGDNEIALVDLGYSGSIQYYLSKIINAPIKGFYFATSNNRKGMKFNGNTMEGFFADNEDYLTSNSSIFKYQLILESILTAPHGQVEKLESDGTNVHYAKSGFSQENFSLLTEVHTGIIEYIKDFLYYYKDIIDEFNPRKNLTESFVEILIKEKYMLSPEISQIFSVEDNYCSSGEISVFDFYRNLFGE